MVAKLSLWATVLALCGTLAAQKMDAIKAEEIEAKLEGLPDYAVGIFGAESTEAFRKKVIMDTMALLRVFIMAEPTDRVPSDGLLLFPAGSASMRRMHNKAWTSTTYEVNQLVEFLDPLVTGTVEKVDGAIFQDWAQNKLRFGTKFVIVLIDNNPKKRHLGFRSLGYLPEIKQEFDLVWVNQNAEVLKDVLRLEKFPSVVSLTMMQGKGGENDKSIGAMPYTGPNVSFGYLYAWLRKIMQQAGGGKDQAKEDRPETRAPEPEFSDEITVMSPFNHKNFLAECDKTPCLLGFENYWLEDSVRFDNTLAELKKVQKGFNRHGLKVLLLDGGCHQDLLQELGLQMEFLPGLVLYNASGPEYTPLMGKFAEKEIKEFVRKANAKIYKPTRLSQKLRVQERDCDAERAKWDALRSSAGRTAEDDELMKEVLDEIKRKENEKKFVKQAQRKRRRSDDL